jgi:CRISPR-associated protein Cas2
MPMTVVVTRDVDPRFRGFLASVTLEIAPGVYTGPQMTTGVRERVWEVLADWFGHLGGGCIVMTWRDPQAPGGQSIRLLGEAPKTLVDADGLLLVKRELPDE